MRSRIAIAAMAVLVPALVLAQKTSFDFDKTADFSKFRTCTLEDGTKVGDPLNIAVVYHVTFDKTSPPTVPVAAARTPTAGAAGGGRPTCE